MVRLITTIGLTIFGICAVLIMIPFLILANIVSVLIASFVEMSDLPISIWRKFDEPSDD